MPGSVTLAQAAFGKAAEREVQSVKSEGSTVGSFDRFDLVRWTGLEFRPN